LYEKVHELVRIKLDRRIT